MNAGPGWECQPVEPPGAIVVVRTTVSVGLAEKILKPGEVSWYGPRLITPSVVGCAPEGGVADATPTSVDDDRSRKPMMMMMMRFMCVYLSALQPFWRSEERRVGKECGFRWLPYHEEKNGWRDDVELW